MTAKEIFAKLTAHFNGKEGYYKAELMSLKMEESDDADEYITRVSNLMDQLEASGWNLPEDVTLERVEETIRREIFKKTVMGAKEDRENDREQLTKRQKVERGSRRAKGQIGM